MGIIKTFTGAFSDALHDTDEHRAEYEREQAERQERMDEIKAKLQANRERRSQAG